MLLYFTQWLPDSSRGRASAIFLGSSATAYIVTGPITGALLELHGAGGIAGRRWMFALEGAFSILVGFIAGFFLVSRIQDAKWLTPEEKEALSEAVARDREARDRAPSVSRWKLIFHPQVAVLTTVFFAMALTGYAITFWLPSLVEEIGGLSPFVNSLGNLGGFVSPTLFGYLKDTTGSTNGGLYTLSAASVLAVVGVAFVRHTKRGEQARARGRAGVSGEAAVR